MIPNGPFAQLFPLMNVALPKNAMHGQENLNRQQSMQTNATQLTATGQSSAKQASHLTSPPQRDTVLKPVLANLTENRQTQLQTLALKAQVNTTQTLLKVLVKEQQPIDKALRNLLLKQINVSTVKSERIQALNALLQQRNAQLLKLWVNGRTQYALSPKPTAVGKSLTIVVNENQSWQVLPSPLQNKTLPTLQQAIRDNLPRALDIASVLRNLTNTVTKQPVSRELYNAIKHLNTFSPTPDKLIQASSLKQIIQRSGSLFEANLVRQLENTFNKDPALFNPALINLSGATSAISQSIPGTIPTSALDKVLRNLFSAKSKQPSAASQPVKNLNTIKTLMPSPLSTEGETGIASKNPATDLKAQLLLIKQLTQTLLQTASPSHAKETNSKESNAKSILKFPAQQKPGDQLPNKQEQGVRQIQQQVIAAIAKIQLQQSQSLIQQSQTNSEGKTLSNALQLEIPVQSNGDFHNVRLQFEEEWIERDAKEESVKVKQWRVNLCIELPDAGYFYACIVHCNDETNVQLWADQAQTAKRVRDNMALLQQRLHQQGVNVKAIQCEIGTPTSQLTKNQLNYALVDVRT